jgi:hypothetical protein
MTTGTVGVAVATEIIATHTAVVAAIIVPGRGAIADRGVGNADNCERTDGLAGLLATLGAGNRLEGIAHGHALFGASATSRTEIFVQRHTAIVVR